MSHEVDRRSFLKAAGTAVASLPLLACTPRTPERCGTTSDELLWRAGSVFMYTSEGFGQGSFIIDQGQYYFYTVEHVASLLNEDPSRSKVIIPGTGFEMRINPSKFVYDNRGSSDFEGAAYYPIEGDQAQALYELMLQKKLTYLVRAKNKNISGEKVAMPRPDSQKHTVMQVKKYYSYANLYRLEQTGNGALCEGRSGSPVLKMCGNTLTNEIYGTVSLGDYRKSAAAETMFGIPLICPGAAYFRPH